MLFRSGGLTNILEELEQCGFIAINDNFSTSKKNKIYQLIDFYSLFYLHFVKDKKGTNSDFWSTLTDNTSHKAWVGFSFELLCQSHIEQIKRGLSIGGVVSYLSGWRSKETKNGAQIDLIIDRNDNVINLCEMKFSNKVFVIDKNYNKVLQNKKWAFAEETRTKKALHTTMITTYGVKQNMYWHTIQSEITMEDLFVH